MRASAARILRALAVSAAAGACGLDCCERLRRGFCGAEAAQKRRRADAANVLARMPRETAPPRRYRTSMRTGVTGQACAQNKQPGPCVVPPAASLRGHASVPHAYIAMDPSRSHREHRVARARREGLRRGPRREGLRLCTPGLSTGQACAQDKHAHRSDRTSMRTRQVCAQE
jgi:hypothetical protein